MSDGEIQKFEEISKNIDKTCRTCLQMSDNLGPLAQKISVEDNHISLMDLILGCAAIQVSDADGFPQQICRTCQEEAITSHRFKKKCEKSDNFLHLIETKCFQKFTNTADLLCKEIEVEESTSLQVTDDLKEVPRIEDKKDKLTCQCCSEIFPDNKSLIQHLKSQIFNSPVEHQNPEVDEQVGVQHTCAICLQNFAHRSSMLRHCRRHNAPAKTCAHCTFKPLNPKDLTKHMEENHAHLKIYKCTICDKNFFKNTNLQRHILLHEGVKRHVCEICGTSFACSSNLLAHRRLHTGEKPYTCSWCGRSFTQHAALRSHEAGHLDKRDHVCSECGVAFSRAGALKNHLKRHSSSKPFECHICGRRFTFSSERKRHMLIHTGAKNYACEICGSKFTRNNNLKVHMRIHTGETPHICEICGKGFVQAHCLKMHLNNHAMDKNN